MASSTNRNILAQETLKAGKGNKGKGVFAGYAKRVKNANNEVTGKEDLCGKKK